MSTNWQPPLYYHHARQALEDCKEAHAFFTAMWDEANERGDEWRAWILQKERERLAAIHARIKAQL